MSALNLLWWLPWTAGLSTLGLVAAWRAWRRQDLRAALGRTGWALAPWALLLLGLYGLVGRIVTAALLWGGRFAFDPTAWLGIGTAVVATGLIVLGRGGKSQPGPAAELPARPAAPEADADIEAILRKHGIT